MKKVIPKKKLGKKEKERTKGSKDLGPPSDREEPASNRESEDRAKRLRSKLGFSLLI